jgi:uncharacterized peroxidase-related enzyme
MHDYREADLSPADRAMLDFAMDLSATPGRMTAEHVQTLRSAGFSDGAIHDIVQVTGLFAYYNRLADGLGIDSEEGFDRSPESGKR